MESVGEPVRLHWVDYVVCGIILTTNVLVGIYHNIKNKSKQTEENYLMANRDMSVFPVACSLFVTTFSATSFLGKKHPL